jgi:(R,R)-butanediol dehydrogenase/meso-butanediol dehydrogenase/diacetyl reductase
MRAARWVAHGVLEVIDIPEPELVGSRDVIVEVAACGVCGSDLESWRHGSNVTAGTVMGHEFGGRVVGVGRDAEVGVGAIVAVRPLRSCGECAQCRRGQQQLCERSLEQGLGYGLPGGFAERVRVPDAVLGRDVVVLPDALDASLGALVEPLAVSLRGVTRAEVGDGDVVVVMGLGQIGLGAVAMAIAQGAAHVVGVDPSARRRQAAVALGARTVVDPIESKVDVEVRAVTGPGAYGLGAAADAVIECSGQPTSFAAGVKSLRPAGRMALIAHSREPFAIKSGRLVEKEITVVGSFAYDDEMREVADLVARNGLDLGAFVSHRIPLSDIDEAFRSQADAATSLKVLVQP